jgi:hypothetical protein
MQKPVVKWMVKGAAALVLAWGVCLHAAHALDVSGRIDADTRWTLEESPVRVTGNVRIAEDAELVIDPGVTVLFKPSPDAGEGFSIVVDGTFTAMGSPGEPIAFTAEDPESPWGSIHFSDTSRDWDPGAEAGCAMEYCVVEYGGNAPEFGAMISTLNATPLIARNALRFSEAAAVSSAVSEDPAAISSASGEIRIVSNRIYANPTGISLSGQGGRVSNNYFLENGRAIDAAARSHDASFLKNTVASSSPELLGAGIRLAMEEPGSGVRSYRWQQTRGPSVSLENPRGAAASFVAPSPGEGMETLAFDLTVEDEAGRQATETVEITVVGENPPPTADAGPDQSVALPEEAGEEVTVTLTAAGSTDSYIGIAGYGWRQVAGIPVTLEGEDIIRPEFTVPETASVGDRMIFELVVVDRAGLTDTDTVEITYYRDNLFPAAAAGEDRRVSQGERVTLDASGSADPDGSITAYQWEQTGGPLVELFNANTARPYFTAPEDNEAPVELSFRVVVADTGGLQDADEVAITVNAALAAVPGADRTVSAGERVVLDGSGSADQSAAANMRLSSNRMETTSPAAGLAAVTASEAAVFRLDVSGNYFKTPEDGGYAVYVYGWPENAPQSLSMPENSWNTEEPSMLERLIYDRGEDYTLPAVDYEPLAKIKPDAVGSTLPYPPLADAGPDLETESDNTVALDGSGSYDPDGIARYRWEQIEGPGVSIKASDQAVAEFIAPSGGEEGETLEFALTVATGGVFSHSDRVIVSVAPDADLPRTDVGGCFINAAGAEGRGSAGGGSSFWFFLPAIFAACSLAGAAIRLRRGFSLLLLGLMLLLLTAAPARAGYFSVGGGAGGDADEVNVTVETGAKDIRAAGMDLLFGMGLHFIPHSEDELPDDTISLPCPNPDCVDLGTERKGTEVGLFGKLGVEVGSSDFYVSAIGGFTAFTESELSRSPATGRVYEDESDSQVEALYGGGISYFMDFRWDVVIHVDYDNIRGVTGAVGFHW